MKRHREIRLTARRERPSPISREVREFRRATALEFASRLRNFAATLGGENIGASALSLLPDVLEQAERLDIGRAAIAEACEVSEATVSRWAGGETRPHAIMARVVLDTIRELALERAEAKEEQIKTLSTAD
jgi:hypothetical protein